MREKKLVEKAIKFLQSKGVKPGEGTIAYRGIMKDVELPDGTIKDMHVIRYIVWIETEAKLCYINADAQTDLLEFHITPHYYEEVEDNF